MTEAPFYELFRGHEEESGERISDSIRLVCSGVIERV
jgi:hypothetical protein